MIKRSLNLLWLAGLFGLLFLLPNYVGAITSSTNSLDVGFTVPNRPPPPPPPLPDSPPTISNVVISPSTSTAQISWSAADDNGLSTVGFEYGISPSYGSMAFISGSYLASLFDLSLSTQYYFRIRVTDSAGQQTTYEGSFTTTALPQPPPPVISGISLNLGVTTTTISWTTSKQADSQLNYGPTPAYGFSEYDPAYIYNHSFSLINLSPSTTYYYRLFATDAVGLATSTANLSFTTLPDQVPPPNPTNLQFSATTSTISLTWTNPSVPDFAGVRLVRKINSQSTSINDGLVLLNGNLESYNDITATPNTNYFYTLFSYDSSGNYSGGVFTNGELLDFVVVEICGNETDDDNNGQSDCEDSACSSLPACAVQQNQIEICDNNIDDDQNGQTDCADTTCFSLPSCFIQPPTTTTNPGGENQNPTPGGSPTGTPGGVQPGEGSAGAGVVTTTPVYVPPETTVPEFIKLTMDDFKFFIGNRQFEVFPWSGKVYGLEASNFSLALNASSLPTEAKSVVVKINTQETHQMKLDIERETYYADLILPPAGEHKAYAQIDYGDGQLDVIEILLVSNSMGRVHTGSQPLSEVEISLHDEKGALFGTSLYGNINPIKSSNTGYFSWVVPNGKYYIIAKKEGYYERKTPVFRVENNQVNNMVYLIPLPPPIDLKNLKTVADRAIITAEIGVQKIADTAAVVVEIKENEEVQKAVSTVVAPTVVSVATVSTVSLVSLPNLLALLQSFFLEPLALLGRKKRKGWGQVYNSLNKLPVDLATVRLLNEAGQVIQSKVTDKHGKYAFVASPGSYTIQVIKNNFTFPSALLKDIKSDGQKTDIYHAEAIKVSEEDAVITVNIPLDPAEEGLSKPVRLYWQETSRRLLGVLSWSGIVVTLISLYISPEWYVWILFLVHLLVLFIFRRLAMPPKLKSWGIVYDIKSKNPVPRAVARLFNMQFNKLVATQVTDNRGRYYFLAGDNEYYITYEHPDYALSKTSTINLKGHEAENINIDIGLKKQ